MDPARRLGRAQIDVFAQLAVSTILLGGIYALIAVGLTLIFGIMRVVNFAHGEFLMLGMYLAFWAYTRTLLPGVDLGDTGGFQAAVLWPENSARRAYPLYYTLATPFIRAVSQDNPARGLNLFSAIWAAITGSYTKFM